MDLELERSAAICASFFPRNVLNGTIVEIENRIFHGRRKAGGEAVDRNVGRSRLAPRQRIPETWTSRG